MKDNFKVFKPAGKMQFEFTDLIAGYVSNFNESEKTFTLTTSDKREFSVALGNTTFARLLRNLDEPYQDATGNMYSLLKQDGRMVFASVFSIPSRMVSTPSRLSRLTSPSVNLASSVSRRAIGGLIRPKVSATSSFGRSSPMVISTTRSIVRPFLSVVRLRRIRSVRRPTPSAV